MSSHYPTLAAYNSGVLRARADYRARPSRACLWPIALVVGAVALLWTLIRDARGAA